MQIDSTHVGVKMKPFHTTIDWRRTTNFAAALGDANPCYFDDARPEGLVAHPVFPVAVTWPVCSQPDKFLQETPFPLEVTSMQVHHTEHITLHRSIRPPEDLTVYGTVAAILSHRAGSRVVMRYEAVNEQGEPVFTEHVGGLLRGVTCTDDGRSLDEIPEPPAQPYVDSPLWQAPVTIDPMLPYIYDGCSDIVFPIHTSPAFASAVGLPGIILQGTATLALAVREMVNREAGGNPIRLKSLGCRFSGMVRPGTEILVILKSRTGENLFFEVLNQDGEKAVCKGHAQIV